MLLGLVLCRGDARANPFACVRRLRTAEDVAAGGESAPPEINRVSTPDAGDLHHYLRYLCRDAVLNVPAAMDRERAEDRGCPRERLTLDV